jgi:uncharacterized repeat protein (TIGR03803 family)
MTHLSALKEAGSLFLLFVAMAIAAPAQTFTTLVNFDGSNGSDPSLMSMVQGKDGSLYGTTLGGGINFEGTAFKLTRTGKIRTLYNFCSQLNCSDGSNPWAGLLLAADGSFYGTTQFGGDVTCPFYNTCGTIFKITPEGTLTTLFSFDESDGELPISRVVQATDRELYGTTSQGGLSNECSQGCGTVFKMTTEGDLTTLHSFNGGDGQGTSAGLAEGTDGNFYGTTPGGGEFANGTVFKITPQGALTTLHSFDIGDGANPKAGLIQGLDGNFYGATIGGGSGGWGVVFKMTPNGTVTILHNFSLTDGGEPYSLIQGTDGNFYGTTYYGGNFTCSQGCGTVFQLTPTGTLTTLHSFDSSDGSVPTGGLVQSTNGTLYGTSSQGGRYNSGTLFSLKMGLGPFVTFVHAAGKVGQTGGILGQGFTGTTSVSLNGIAATFTIVSDTYIKATVPAGATTGYVTVTTPTGTLTSNVPFHVIP